MITLIPFANETDVFDIDDLTVENRLDRVSLYGSAILTKDRAGLHLAKQLKAVIDAVVLALEAEKNLPAQVATKPVEKIKNPFG